MGLAIPGRQAPRQSRNAAEWLSDRPALPIAYIFRISDLHIHVGQWQWRHGDYYLNPPLTLMMTKQYFMLIEFNWERMWNVQTSFWPFLHLFSQLLPLACLPPSSQFLFLKVLPLFSSWMSEINISGPVPCPFRFDSIDQLGWPFWICMSSQSVALSIFSYAAWWILSICCSSWIEETNK